MYSEKEIIKILASSIDEIKYPYQLPNVFIYGWECDYWAMTTGGETREFEIKISKSDFKNDIKKEKHRVEKGANYFYYVTPSNLVTVEEVNSVDKRYGLIHINESGSVAIVKKPRKLNNTQFDSWKMLANKMYWKWWSLWRQKYIDKEITRKEWVAGFVFDLEQDDSSQTLSALGCV